MADVNAEWVADGHEVKVVANEDKFEVTFYSCPNKRRKGTDCWHPQADGCVVDWYVFRYGLELNKGSAPIEFPMKVAWTHVGDTADLEKSQVWLIPMNDDAFAALLTERMTDE